MVNGCENENKLRHVWIISLVDFNFLFILHMRRCDTFLLIFFKFMHTRNDSESYWHQRDRDECPFCLTFINCESSERVLMSEWRHQMKCFLFFLCLFFCFFVLTFLIDCFCCFLFDWQCAHLLLSRFLPLQRSALPRAPSMTSWRGLSHVKPFFTLKRLFHVSQLVLFVRFQWVGHLCVQDCVCSGWDAWGCGEHALLVPCAQRHDLCSWRHCSDRGGQGELPGVCNFFPILSHPILTQELHCS